MEQGRSKGRFLDLVRAPAEQFCTPLTRESAFLVSLFIALYGFVLVRTAWIADDAYITFRTIDNFTNGYGLTWNVSERVQAFTHPLWMIVLSGLHFYTREFFLTCILLSVVLSILAIGVLGFGIARSLAGAFLALSILTLSRAFVDYSTSGLENSATHILLALFCLVLFRYELDLRSLAVLSLIAAFGTLNRMDAILLFAPALAYGCLSLRRWRGLAMVTLGFVPFFLWEVFSLVYYGFLFPNTAYAKLFTGLGRTDLIGQGFRYLLDSINCDPLTLFAIGAGLIVPFLVKSWRATALAAGVVLSLVYVVSIGGDFMSGRFLAAPLLVGAILVSRLPFERRTLTAIAPFGIVLLLGWTAPHPTLLSGAEYGQDYKIQGEQIDRNGISDERAFYYPVTGLLRAERDMPVPSPRQIWVDDALRVRDEGPKVTVRNSVGFFGYTVGPGVHVIDEFGLGDALMARLPPAWRPKWRIGHFFRTVPAGYVETLSAGRILLEDKGLAEYYEKLSLIIRGPLFDRARWVAILGMNFGRYEYLIDRDLYRFPRQVKIDLAQAQGQTPSQDGSGEAASWPLPPSGIEIRLGNLSHAVALELSIDNGHDYIVSFVQGERELSRQQIWGRPKDSPAVVARRIDVPARAADRGFDRVRVFPADGSGEARFQHLRLIQ